MYLKHVFHPFWSSRLTLKSELCGSETQLQKVLDDQQNIFNIPLPERLTEQQRMTLHLHTFTQSLTFSSFQLAND